MSLIGKCPHSGVSLERGSTVYDIEGEEERERKSVFNREVSSFRGVLRKGFHCLRYRGGGRKGEEKCL